LKPEIDLVENKKIDEKGDKYYGRQQYLYFMKYSLANSYILTD